MKDNIERPRLHEKRLALFLNVIDIDKPTCQSHDIALQFLV